MTLTLPTGHVTFNFPTPETNNRTTIVIPVKSKWTTTLHWHETHTEYIRILKGRARVTIGKVTRDYGPEDRDLRIDNFVTHEYMRADVDRKEEEKDEGEVEVLEWTDPGMLGPLLLLSSLVRCGWLVFLPCRSGWLQRGLLPERDVHIQGCGLQDWAQQWPAAVDDDCASRQLRRDDSGTCGLLCDA